MKHHIGFVVAANTPQRVEELLTQYMDRIARDFHAALPGADKGRALTRMVSIF